MGWNSNLQELKPAREIIVSIKSTADHERNGRSLCGYILYTGGRHSNHDRKDQGDGENHAIHGIVILHRRKKKFGDEKIKV